MTQPANTNLLYNIVSYAGVIERPGPGSDPTVLDSINLIFPNWKDDSTIAWCSCWMNLIAQNVCAETTLHLEKPCLARSWLQVGEEVELDNLRPGDVVVLTRGPINNGKGHVGVFFARRGGKIYLYGGNQGNRVCESAYSERRFLGGRRLRLLE